MPKPLRLPPRLPGPMAADPGRPRRGTPLRGCSAGRPAAKAGRAGAGRAAQRRRQRSTLWCRTLFVNYDPPFNTAEPKNGTNMILRKLDDPWQDGSGKVVATARP